MTESSKGFSLSRKTPEELFETAALGVEEDEGFEIASNKIENPEASTAASPEPPAPPESDVEELDEEPETFKKTRKLVPSESDDVKRAERVIRVLDAIRDLDGETREVARQIITNSDEQLSSEGEFVVKIFNAPLMLSKTMTALKEAKDLEPVDRAFYLIELGNKTIHNLASLVEAFQEEETTEIADAKQHRNGLPRVLVTEIERISPRNMGYIEATESLLQSAEKDEE